MLQEAKTLMWFRRDLRAHDHPAFAAAAASPCIAVYVLDRRLLQNCGRAKREFLHDNIRALDESLGGHLLVLEGDPLVEIPRLVRRCAITSVHVTKEHTPYGRMRDAAMAQELAAGDVEFVQHSSNYVVEPGTIRKPDGGAYRAFKPYWARWRGLLGDAEPLPAVETRNVYAIEVGGLPEMASSAARPGGEGAAVGAWRLFLESALNEYHDQRDRMDLRATSRMSAYLRFGAIHPRTLVTETLRADVDDSAREAYLRELCWREFYADVLHHNPESAWRNLDATMDGIEVDEHPQALERFQAWCDGRTGYPIVDAGMRELLDTGWMHNRARMITASFLVKDLHLPWQWGARYFLNHLIDGDIASNNHGWQWVAGTGADAQPYFRVMNPSSQAERHDPTGSYRNLWVPHDSDPEHSAYAVPVVDHAAERAEALRRWRETREHQRKRDAPI
jgi:deoxyribodipyrimidine photo-lyase